MGKIRHAAGKTWHFLWHENSTASWIVNIILAFVIIKFIVYPLLGWLLGTSLPIVAVVSSSMEHDLSFEQWWAGSCCVSSTKTVLHSDIYESRSISKQTFSSFSFRNGFNKGDIMILGSADKVDVGDILVFRSPNLADPIIHRIVSKADSVVSTLGDNNCNRQGSHEIDIPKERILGKALLRLPLLGWVKIGFMELWMTGHCLVAPRSDQCRAWQVYKQAQEVQECSVQNAGQ